MNKRTEKIEQMINDPKTAISDLVEMVRQCERDLVCIELGFPLGATSAEEIRVEYEIERDNQKSCTIVVMGVVATASFCLRRFYGG